MVANDTESYSRTRPEKHYGQDSLNRLKKNVERWHTYWRTNISQYYKLKRFLFSSTLSQDEKSVLDEIGQPQIECNLCEAYVNRLRGEFCKQEPSVIVSAQHGTQVDLNAVKIVEAHLRDREAEARKNGVAMQIYTDVLCGFSVAELYTEYENELSFKQDLKWKRVFDPAMCGFDPLAQEIHKGDGEYCFKWYPKSEDEFKEEYSDVNLSGVSFVRSVGDGFNWSYSDGDQKIVLVCEYYEKKKIKKRLVQIAPTPFVVQNNIPTSMLESDYNKLIAQWDSFNTIEQPPVIINKRETFLENICRYVFIENQILDYVETSFTGLPLIFFDGNSQVIRESENGKSEQLIRAYFHNAIGTQKLANVALQSCGNELENLIQHKLIVPKESIPAEKDYMDAYKNFQIPNILVYNAFLQKEGAKPGDVPLPPPTVLTRQPFPQEILATLQMCFTLMQNTLGSYDASLGINNNQLSGVAIVEGATQSNATAMPLVANYIFSYNRLLQLYVEMLPKYLIGESALPVMLPDGTKHHATVNGEGQPQLNYDKNALRVSVEAGVNFTIQKNQSLNQIQAMMQSSQVYSQFINEKCLDVLVDNQELRNQDQMQERAKEFMSELAQQKQAAAQQMQDQMGMNPLVMKAQIEAQKLQFNKEKLAVENHQHMIDANLKAAEIQEQTRASENDRIRIALDARKAHEDNLVNLDRHQMERRKQNVELATHIADLSHRHNKEALELHHKLMNTAEKHYMHEAKEVAQEEEKEHEHERE